MTSKELASLLQAKRAGAGWSAKCPAHEDGSPSLSIREGEGGRILLHCFAGCSIDNILAALNMGRRALFAGPPPTPAQLAAIRGTQEAKAQGRAFERQARHAAIQSAQRLQSVVNALGGKLMRHPEDDALVTAFHQACELLHKAETIVDAFYESRRRDSTREGKVA